MKQSLMTSILQYAWTSSGTATFQNPQRIALTPGGSFITSVDLESDLLLYARLTQEGRVLFPNRSVNGVADGWFVIKAATGTAGIYQGCYLQGLWIPIKPDVPLVCEFADNTVASAHAFVVVTIASTDERSLMLDTVREGFIKLIAKEVKK